MNWTSSSSSCQAPHDQESDQDLVQYLDQYPDWDQDWDLALDPDQVQDMN